MTQYARPDYDTDFGGWDNSEIDQEDLWDYVNELDDDTYIFIEAEYGSDEEITFRLSDVDTPDSGTRTVTVRASDDSGGAMGSITVTLKEGGSAVQSGEVFDNLAGSAGNHSFNITGSISNYSNLSITISGTDQMGMGLSIFIYNIFFSVPDAAAAEAATSEAFLLFVD